MNFRTNKYYLLILLAAFIVGGCGNSSGNYEEIESSASSESTTTTTTSSDSNASFVAVGISGTIVRSTDNGSSFSTVTSPTSKISWESDSETIPSWHWVHQKPS